MSAAVMLTNIIAFSLWLTNLSISSMLDCILLQGMSYIQQQCSIRHDTDWSWHDHVQEQSILLWASLTFLPSTLTLLGVATMQMAAETTDEICKRKVSWDHRFQNACLWNAFCNSIGSHFWEIPRQAGLVCQEQSHCISSSRAKGAYLPRLNLETASLLAELDFVFMWKCRSTQCDRLRKVANTAYHIDLRVNDCSCCKLQPSNKGSHQE